MTNRKFYRTTVVIEILTEDKHYNPQCLEHIGLDISSGDCSGTWKITKSETLNGKQAAKALIAQGSDPEFFGIDEDGYSLLG